MKENTDIYGDTYERYKAKLENCGVCFLENKAENIEKNGMKFSIYGLELDSSVNRKFKKADVTEKTVEEKIGKKGKDYSILMAHNPAYMDAYKKWGADLILSGHLHGGLVRCPCDWGSCDAAGVSLSEIFRGNAQRRRTDDSCK